MHGTKLYTLLIVSYHIIRKSCPILSVPALKLATRHAHDLSYCGVYGGGINTPASPATPCTRSPSTPDSLTPESIACSIATPAPRSRSRGGGRFTVLNVRARRSRARGTGVSGGLSALSGDASAMNVSWCRRSVADPCGGEAVAGESVRRVSLEDVLRSGLRSR